MQISIKLSIAVHCLVFIHAGEGKAKVTSNLLAESTGSNPVVIRTILSALKKAGIITVSRGTGGATLRAAPSEVTLYDIYCALEPDGIPSFIGIHPCDGRPCPVAKNIRAVLEPAYRQVEEAVKTSMKHITLQSMLEAFDRAVSESGGRPEN